MTAVDANHLCEWDPEKDQPARGIPRGHGLYESYSGCRRTATLHVGGGTDNWRLCDSCAQLPRFARKRRRVPIRVPGETT